MIQEFKDFINRGNVLEVAVAFVLGLAFAAVVAATLDGIVTPFIAAVFGEPNLTNVGTFTVNDAAFSIGIVLDALFNFATTAAALFVIVKAYQAMRRADPEVPAPATELQLLGEIRDALVAGRGTTAALPADPGQG